VARRGPHQTDLDRVRPVFDVGDLLERHRAASHTLRQQRQHELELVVGLDDVVSRPQLLDRLLEPQVVMENQPLQADRHRAQSRGAGRRTPLAPLRDAGVEQHASYDDRQVGAQLAFTSELAERNAAVLEQLHIDVRCQLLRFINRQSTSATHDGDRRVDRLDVSRDDLTRVRRGIDGPSDADERLADPRGALDHGRGRLHLTRPRHQGHGPFRAASDG
jgi:hypothetical protein